MSLATFQWAAVTDAWELHTLEVNRRGGCRRNARRGVGAGDVAQRRVVAIRGVVDRTAAGFQAGR